MNLLDQLYSFRDQLQGFVDNPHAFMQQLQSNHVLLVEVMGVAFLVLFLLYLLLKPSVKVRPKKSVAVVQDAAPTVQKANARSASKEKATAPNVVVSGRQANVNKTVKAVQEEARQQEARQKQELLALQEAEAEKEKVRLQELSQEEELALAKAIEEAGQLALAEVAGEPHQTEFFEKEGLAETAAKSMFAKPKEDVLVDESPMQVPLKKTTAPRMDFLMLYYMAPRSQAYSVVELFNLFDDFSLRFNSDHVFEFTDDEGVQFYLASALKPGAFALDPLAQVPGLSFVLDLNKVEHPRAAFGKMLKFIDELTHHLKGDVLDERRQRMTTSTMNEYLARIKSLRKN